MDPAAASQLRASCYKSSGRETPFVPIKSEPHLATCLYYDAGSPVAQWQCIRLLTQNFKIA